MPPSPLPPDGLRLLRNRIHEFLGKLLRKLTCSPPPEPVNIEHNDGAFHVWIRVAAFGTSPDDTLNLVQPGQWLSDLEQRIVDLFRGNGNAPLNKKEICEAIRRNYNTDTRTIIENLSDRAGGRAILEEADDGRFRLKSP